MTERLRRAMGLPGGGAPLGPGLPFTPFSQQGLVLTPPSWAPTPRVPLIPSPEASEPRARPPEVLRPVHVGFWFLRA